MKKIASPLLLLLIFLCLNITDTLACGREYSIAEKLPLQNDTLALEALLVSTPAFPSPFWSSTYSPDRLIHRNELFSQLIAASGNAKINDAGIDTAGVIALALEKDQFQLLSDFALCELQIGNRISARELLEKLQAKYPNEYNINANLSLAYELNGDSQKALLYLEKALNINSRYQFNSEWIHLNLLKEKSKKSPDYSAIMGLKTDDFSAWFNKPEGFPRNPDSLKKEIAFQLHHRGPLFGTKDEPEARLLLDFADIVAKHDGGQAAFPFYAYLVKNHPSYASLIEKRLEVIRRKEGEIKNTFRWASLIWLIPLTLFGLFFAAWINSLRRNRREKQGQ